MMSILYLTANCLFSTDPVPVEWLPEKSFETILTLDIHLCN